MGKCPSFFPSAIYTRRPRAKGHRENANESKTTAGTYPRSSCACFPVRTCVFIFLFSPVPYNIFTYIRDSVCKRVLLRMLNASFLVRVGQDENHNSRGRVPSHEIFREIVFVRVGFFFVCCCFANALMFESEFSRFDRSF